MKYKAESISRENGSFHDTVPAVHVKQRFFDLKALTAVICTHSACSEQIILTLSDLSAGSFAASLQIACFFFPESSLCIIAIFSKESATIEKKYAGT